MNNLSDIMNNIDMNELNNFFANTKRNFLSISNIKETKIDHSWLNILEDTLPNIDKIVRNPRRFIIQEEDVVIIEKIKKISQETIKHLAVHSQNIQDIDENNEVVPKKLLNVHKEDTQDLYENRFIYTLVKRLENFISLQLENLDIISKKEINKEVTYKGETILDNRKINIDLKINEFDKFNLDEDQVNMRNRIIACYETIMSFRTTEMIKNLAGCSLVKNPIRKTNLILRQPDFQKAFILWEYLDNFEFKDPKTINYETKKDSSKEIADEFTLSYFVNCNALDENSENLMKYNNLDAKLNKLMNEYVYEDVQDINDFVGKVKELYDNSLQEKENRINEITSIYNQFINNHKNILRDLEEC